MYHLSKFLKDSPGRDFVNNLDKVSGKKAKFKNIDWNISFNFIFFKHIREKHGQLQRTRLSVLRVLWFCKQTIRFHVAQGSLNVTVRSVFCVVSEYQRLTEKVSRTQVGSPHYIICEFEMKNTFPKRTWNQTVISRISWGTRKCHVHYQIHISRNP